LLWLTYAIDIAQKLLSIPPEKYYYLHYLYWSMH